MNMNRKTLTVTGCLVLGTILLAGCSKSGKQPEAPIEPSNTINTEPVTIKIWRPTASLWDDLYVAPMKKKFPHITLEQIKDEPGSRLPELIAAGNIPDIIQHGPGFIYDIIDSGLHYDMTPLIKSYKFDLGNINPVALETLKGYTEGNEVYGLPITLNNGALYYNKDIFNKFAVPFPKDGMTWNEVLELAKRIEGKNDGQTYRGLMIQLHSHIAYNSLSLPFVDRKKDMAMVHTDQWQSLFNLMKSIHNIGAWKMEDLGNKEIQYFLKDKTVAMVSITNILGLMKDAMSEGLDWDMVSMPTFPQAPNTGFTFNGPVHFITSTSKHKEQAFAVVSHFLSDEVQMLRSKAGEPTVLTNPDVQAAYGTNLPHLKGKNVTAILPKKIAPVSPSISKYDAIAASEMVARLKDVIVNDKDVNTALREADENINKKIQEQKAK